MEFNLLDEAKALLLEISLVFAEDELFESVAEPVDPVAEPVDPVADPVEAKGLKLCSLLHGGFCFHYLPNRLCTCKHPSDICCHCMCRPMGRQLM